MFLHLLKRYAIVKSALGVNLIEYFPKGMFFKF